MTDKSAADKRARPRLLCSDQFSDCSIKVNEQQFIAQSINFNQCGIGVFAMSRLPDLKNFLLGFSFNDNEIDISIDNLEAVLVYVNETDVGHQYGFKFGLSKAGDEVKGKLINLEYQLELQAKNHRYGLFT